MDELSQPAYETLLVAVESGVATVTLNRPHVKNAISRTMGDELAQAFEALGRDPTVRAVVLRGAGQDFCAGGDVSGMAEAGARTTAQAHVDMQRYRRMTLAIHDIDKPVIASVDGVAYGAGFSLLLLADMVLVSDRVRLSLAFARLGLLPDCGALYTLPRVVGVQRAKELVLSGRAIGASEARDLGLAMEIAAPDSLHARALAMALGLTGASPMAASLSKRALNLSLDADLSTMLELEASGQAIALTNDYMAECRRRFLAKEPAQFQWPA